MKVSVLEADITRLDTPVLIVNLFKGVTHPTGATGSVDNLLENSITSLIADKEITGARGELTLIHTLGKMPTKRILVVGLGEQESFNNNTIRFVVAEACRYLQEKGITSASTILHGGGIGQISPEIAATSITEGCMLGLYSFNKYKQSDKDIHQGSLHLTVVDNDQTKIPLIADGINKGKAVSEGVFLARDLVNEPANILTPAEMAERAKHVASNSNMNVTILDKEQLQANKMNALLAVGSGSIQEPKLIILKHEGDPDNPNNHIAIVGKGITFDSGGISLKPAAGMWEMKGDMGGGASVLGTMQAISSLRPKINVIGVIAAAENMPSGSAVRPGDIIKAMNGTTIEVDNTDAEGRMALADAVHYTEKVLGITKIIDIATLTGAMITTLGTVGTGILGSDQNFVDQIIDAGDRIGEKLWQLPLWDEYKEQNKSTWADIKNTGGRGGGAITAAFFIKAFIDKASWAHLDIAGTFMAKDTKGYTIKGATGTPVRTLIELITNLATQ
jgi:leucyl aminopeptidase